MRLQEGPVLAKVAARRRAIVARCDGFDMGGMIYPARKHFDVAMERLRLFSDRLENGASQENCYCRVFGQLDITGPEFVAKSGRVEVIETIVHREQRASDYRCKCSDCGARFNVREETGWHLPTYEWRAV